MARRPAGIVPAQLPDFVAPMLAVAGQPFDSDRHFFEIKWDGIRCVALRGRTEPNLFSRNRRPLGMRYPELAEAVARLPTGLVLDGEIVVLEAGKPSFAAVMQRPRGRSARHAAAVQPAAFVVFDLLYEKHQPLLSRPFAERRERLERVAAGFDGRRLVMSQGVHRDGRDFFDAACRNQLEGIVGKDLGSPYLAGKRSTSWVKIKRQIELVAVVIGYLQKGRNDFQSLVLAAPVDGTLRYIGNAGSGFDEALRDRLRTRLFATRCDTPIVPCSERAHWVKPEVHVRVRAMEWSTRGRLRAPVLVEWIAADG